MGTTKPVNSIISFFIEIAMLVALGVAGYRLGSNKWIQIMLVIAFPFIAVVIWGVWAAPKSARRLSRPSLTIFKLTLFWLTGLLLFLTGFQMAAIVFTVCAFLNELLAAWLKA